MAHINLNVVTCLCEEYHSQDRQLGIAITAKKGCTEVTKDILVFTPINPLRPFSEKLGCLHRHNVLGQNDTTLFDYVEQECLLPSNMQKEGLYRGQNVVRNFNEVYVRNKDKYKFICKWDDDIVMPAGTIQRCLQIFRDEKCIGVGLFQENYGAPNILKINPVKEGWTGAFSRFYIYRMEAWGVVPVILGSSSGDPDNKYQRSINGTKHILDCVNIHLDHRACGNNPALYKVLLDLAEYMVIK